MKRNLILILALTLLTLPLHAQEIIDNLSTEELASLFKTEGYSYEIDEDGDIVRKLEGVSTLVIRQSDGECLSFRVSFKNEATTLAKINEWNNTKRYSHTYLDDDGDPVLQADLDLAGGVTCARIQDFLLTCKALMLAWQKEVL